MTQKTADALVEFGADNVLKFAGLRMRFVIVDAKCVLEESLGQTVAPHYVARAVSSAIR
jgi:hypothetical protein